MADWTYWLIGAGVLIVAELFIGTFYLLMIALGLVFGALADVEVDARVIRRRAPAAAGKARAAQDQRGSDPDRRRDERLRGAACAQPGGQGAGEKAQCNHQQVERADEQFGHDE